MDKQTRERFLNIEREERQEIISTQPNLREITRRLHEEIEKSRMEVEEARAEIFQLGQRIIEIEYQIDTYFPNYDREGRFDTPTLSM